MRPRCLLSPLECSDGTRLKVRHQLLRRLESGEISQLRCDDNGGDELNSAQRLERLHQRCQAPALDQFFHVARQLRDALGGLLDGAQVIGQDALLGLVLKRLLPDLVEVTAAPRCLALVDPPVPQQKLAQLMPRAPIDVLRVISRLLEVAHRLSRLVRYRDRGQVTAESATASPCLAGRSLPATRPASAPATAPPP